MSKRQVRSAEYRVVAFGKHKGQSVRSVPDSYLLWCVESMPAVPHYIKEEVVRRSAFKEVFIPYALEQSMVWERKEDLRKPVSRKKRNTKSTQKKSTPKKFAASIGEHADRLHREFLDMGGDPDCCPFDTDDYTAPGPHITWDGDYPVMNHVVEEVDREFQRRVRDAIQRCPLRTGQED